MSYAEAKADRRRRRKGGDAATFLALIQGLGQTLMHQKDVSSAKADALAKENRDAEREAARDKEKWQHELEMLDKRHEKELEVAKIYAGARGAGASEWESEGQGYVSQYGQDPESALSAIDQKIAEGQQKEGILFDPTYLLQAKRAITRVMGAQNIRGRRAASPVAGAGAQGAMAGAEMGGSPGGGGPLGPVQQTPDMLRALMPSQPKAEPQNTGDLESNPAAPRGSPDPDLEAKREQVRQILEGRMRQRQQGAKGPMAAAGPPPPTGVGAQASGFNMSDEYRHLMTGSGGQPPLDPAGKAYWRMSDAYRRFQAGDPTGFMELQDLFGGILPVPKGMGMDTNYPRQRFSGLGTTTLPY